MVGVGLRRAYWAVRSQNEPDLASAVCHIWLEEIVSELPSVTNLFQRDGQFSKLAVPQETGARITKKDASTSGEKRSQ